MSQELTQGQLAALTITERTTSALSLLGFLLVVYTFLFCEGFQKPVNRLIFYAAWSNLGSTIVGFISRDGLPAGQASALCQTQAFLFQMFGGVDCYWALCMAWNVYLALFRGWTTQRMQKQEWKYLTACYGLSLIPAAVYIFLRTEERGRVYGPAILWCWIAPEWAFLRIATLYAIVWLALFGALGIYCIALAKAWRHRRSLVGLLNPLNENPFAGTITTDIEIVFSHGESGGHEEQNPFGSRFDRLGSQERAEEGTTKNPYTVVVQGTRYDSRSRPELLRLPTLTRNAALAEENVEAWLYARIAFLYFLSMIICWIPASINRLVSVIKPDDVIFGLNYVAICGLPLQGFLNGLVYYISSQTATKRLFGRCWTRSTAWRRTPGKPRTKDSQRIRDSYPASTEGGDIMFKDQTTHHSAAASRQGSRSAPVPSHHDANSTSRLCGTDKAVAGEGPVSNFRFS
ncbi:MAG: hypothetical protein OHK93_007221 [Ramalina farinacea]|uniref:G-protein coupled receptors family 2 profile 2 domain-containing protein n=1 Tax=Ramalina farinacea TaxID=258253 RepID=A0AA43QK23_9LECA|nr:hypothetical protein [Ramalina farinacea]